MDMTVDLEAARDAAAEAIAYHYGTSPVISDCRNLAAHVLALCDEIERLRAGFMLIDCDCGEPNCHARVVVDVR